MSDNVPVLSIVMPTYNYTEGPKNLLELIDKYIDTNKVEIIISDDSTDDSIYTLSANYSFVKYQKHIRTPNPIDNWNSGVRLATGRYVLLLHHDEQFIDQHSIIELISVLSRNNAELHVLRCLINLDNEIRSLSVHKLLFQKFFLHFPISLFILNWIGSPSILVFKNRYESNCWDRELSYLVDVDFYYRMIKSGLLINFIENVTIVSNVRSESITASIYSKIEGIYTKEINYINKKYSLGSIKYLLIKISHYLIVINRNLKKVLKRRSIC